MKKIALLCLTLCTICIAAPKYDPTSDYTVKKIEGFKVLVNKKLLAHPQLAEDTLRLLEFQLYQMTRVVPKKALDELRRVAVWAEYAHPRHPCMCYHPSRQWLTQNDFNPEKERSVEIANARNFLTWTIAQPWMVLHEFAHAYHHNVLGYGNADIKKAFNDAVKTKTYESVLHINGRKQRAYALNNDQEYFAECSEAYFGTNDFYPFVKSELKHHDPNMHNTLKKLWSPD